MSDLIINLTNANYTTFVNQILASNQVLSHSSADVNNGQFKTSLGTFRWVYNPAGGSGNAGEIAFHIVTDTFPFATTSALQTYLTGIAPVL